MILQLTADVCVQPLPKTSTFTDPLHGKLFFEIEDTKRVNDEEDAGFDVDGVVVGEFVGDGVSAGELDDDAAITPELTPADAVGSALVATVMTFELPEVVAPMIRPVNVMV